MENTLRQLRKENGKKVENYFAVNKIQERKKERKQKRNRIFFYNGR